MQPNRRIGTVIKTLSSAFSQEANRRAAEVDLTGSQALFLGYLIHHDQEPVYPRDLEREFEFSHPTVSGILSRLGKKGFVSFQSGVFDRRRKQILVTEQGRTAHAAIIRRLDEIEQKALSGMTEADVEEFHRLLGIAMQNLGAAMCCKPIRQEEKPQ